jgi:hypothetical protein
MNGDCDTVYWGEGNCLPCAASRYLEQAVKGSRERVERGGAYNQPDDQFHPYGKVFHDYFSFCGRRARNGISKRAQGNLPEGHFSG